jgi:UTP:GlnB (protein PII) uridylyltransferase
VTDTGPSEAYVREFVESLPATYRHRYAEAAHAAHARIALGRGDAVANAGVFDSNRRDAQALCIVAADRPGLLATISAALVVQKLDVVNADAHTRHTPTDAGEAVDLFWVRRTGDPTRGEPLSSDEIEALKVTLIELLEGTLGAPETSAASSGTETRVRFIENDAGSLGTLEVETGDRSGLLLSLARALFQQRVQIVQSSVRTVDERVQDRFQIVELDGSPISPERRLQIQVAVISALEPVPAGG